MHIMQPAHLAIVLLLALPAVSQAQSVYKCGNTFSQTPCGPDAKQIGTPPVVRTKEPPSAEQLAANIETCERRTRAAMFDPDAAKISNIRRHGVFESYYDGQRAWGVVYFLDVNGKNKFGGYVGEKLYECVFAMDEKTYRFSRVF